MNADVTLEQYALDHMTRPSKLCEELAEFTRKNAPMSIMLCGPLVGGFLGLLCRLLRPKRVLEIGCYTGYSALAMAEQTPRDCEIVTLDIDAEQGAIAGRYWERSDHGRKIQLLLGPALETLMTLKGPFDLVFIDADKGNYLNYLQDVLTKVSNRAVIVADNCLYSGQVLEPHLGEPNARAIHAFNEWVAANAQLRSCFLPLRDGLQVITKVGE